MKTILLALLFTLQSMYSPIAFANTSFNRKIDSGTYLPGKKAPTNHIKNPYCEVLTSTPGIVSPGVNTSVAVGTSLDGGHSCDLTAGSVGDTVFWTTNNLEVGGNCEAKVKWKGDASKWKAYVMDSTGTTKYGGDTQLADATNDPGGIREVRLPYQVCLANARVYLEVTATGAAVPKVGVYYGEATNIGTVAQANLFGSAEQAGASGCSYSENTSTAANNFVALGTGSGCNGWTVTDSVTAIAANDHRINLNNGAAGIYQIFINGSIYSSTAAQNCNFRLHDGTNGYQPQVFRGTGTDQNTPSLTFTLDYRSTSFTSKTLTIQAGDDGTGTCGIQNSVAGYGMSWKVYYFPSAAQSAVNINQPKPPTITKYTSGSGTYTVPTGATQIRVRMVGAGGGGGGSGSGGTAGNNGSATTTFGTSLLSANVGTGGAGGSGGTGGAGGSASCGSVTNCTAITGGNGGGGGFSTDSNGGGGGVNPFGGAAPSTYRGTAGVTAAANTGAGGSGGGGSGTVGGGVGGGSGGYIDAWIRLSDSYWASSFSYAVGNGGANGSAGTGGNAGGSGAAGYIEITEYYGVNIPIIMGSVIAQDNPNNVTTINTVVTKSSTYTATTNEETIEQTGGNTVNLPAASSVRGKKFIIRQTDNSGRVTISPASGNVCGQSSILLSGLNDTVELQSNGTNYLGVHQSDCRTTRSATVTCSSSSSIDRQSGNWISSIGNISAGLCNITVASGVFTNYQNCVGSGNFSNITGPMSITLGVASATSLSVDCYSNADCSTYSAAIVCEGPR